jgi:hypothetical protein
MTTEQINDRLGPGGLSSVAVWNSTATALLDPDGLEVPIGGGGTPGGADTQIQFNDGGAFAGDSGFTFDKTNNALTLGGATVTTSKPVLDLSQTWNDAGVTFTGIKANFTSTASAAASLLLDLQLGGTTKLKLNWAGALTLGGDIINFTNYAEINSAGNGYEVFLSNNGTRIAQARATTSYGFAVCGDYPLGFANGATATTDVALRRDAANTLALRNSTNAQTFRNYRTYTDGSNYQRLALGWNTSTALLHNEGAGTGADGSVAFNDAALATDATKGFVMIPSCAGTPTGTPADIPTGQIPLVFDSTNNKIYAYDGGWLATAALT